VDIVEPIAKFSDSLKGKSGVGEIFNTGLEDWSPKITSDRNYDLIWNQWCLGHLTDAQLVIYLEKCSKLLNENGFFIVKENMSTAGEDVFDEIDSSVTRYVSTKLVRRGRTENRIGRIINSESFSRRRRCE
jgi:protein N-terminal methyltransferase